MSSQIKIPFLQDSAKFKAGRVASTNLWIFAASMV
jgi:hypothetical protein